MSPTVSGFRVFATGVIASDTRHGRENPVGIRGDLAADEERIRSVIPMIGNDEGSRAQVGIHRVPSNPGASGALVGIADLARLDKSVRVTKMGPLPGDALCRIDKIIDSDLGKLYLTRYHRAGTKPQLGAPVRNHLTKARPKILDADGGE